MMQGKEISKDGERKNFMPKAGSAGRGVIFQIIEDIRVKWLRSRGSPQLWRNTILAGGHVVIESAKENAGPWPKPSSGPKKECPEETGSKVAAGPAPMVKGSVYPGRGSPLFFGTRPSWTGRTRSPSAG